MELVQAAFNAKNEPAAARLRRKAPGAHTDSGAEITKPRRAAVPASAITDEIAAETPEASSTPTPSGKDDLDEEQEFPDASSQGLHLFVALLAAVAQHST